MIVYSIICSFSTLVPPLALPMQIVTFPYPQKGKEEIIRDTHAASKTILNVSSYFNYSTSKQFFSNACHTYKVLFVNLNRLSF